MNKNVDNLDMPQLKKMKYDGSLLIEKIDNNIIFLLSLCDELRKKITDDDIEKFKSKYIRFDKDITHFFNATIKRSDDIIDKKMHLQIAT